MNYCRELYAAVRTKTHLVVVHRPEEEAGAGDLQQLVLVQDQVDLQLLQTSLQASLPVHHEPHCPALSSRDEVDLLLSANDNSGIYRPYHSPPERNRPFLYFDNKHGFFNVNFTRNNLLNAVTIVVSQVFQNPHKCIIQLLKSGMSVRGSERFLWEQQVRLSSKTSFGLF